MSTCYHCIKQYKKSKENLTLHHVGNFFTKIKFKIWRVTFLKSFLPLKNFGIDFQFSRNRRQHGHPGYLRALQKMSCLNDTSSSFKSYSFEIENYKIHTKMSDFRLTSFKAIWKKKINIIFFSWCYTVPLFIRASIWDSAKFLSSHINVETHATIKLCVKLLFDT